MLKEHIRLGHAGIVDHSVQFTDIRLKKTIEKDGQKQFLKSYIKA